jgi:hypothetical protein
LSYPDGFGWTVRNANVGTSAALAMGAQVVARVNTRIRASEIVRLFSFFRF